MAALKEIARDVASEIRDGIGWVIVYRTGRSWHSVTLYSDLGNNEWETDDINDAIEALRLDPRAVALNGYYLGHFGDMTIEDIAAGIRYHYERGTNALADDDILTQARADIASGGWPGGRANPLHIRRQHDRRGLRHHAGGQRSARSSRRGRGKPLP